MMVDFHLLTGDWGRGSLPTQALGERRSDPWMLEQEYERRKQVQGVLCTLSSAVCKIAAVAQGWKLAFEDGRWVDVDWGDAFDWRPTEAL